MRKTYKSSNVRFCMEDKNQHRDSGISTEFNPKGAELLWKGTLGIAFVLVLDEKICL